jgi:pimeloyl-ACP methyl ester carboxylesterase
MIDDQVFGPSTPSPALDMWEGEVRLGDLRLCCRDARGPGEPVIFLHPATGSCQSWSFQEDAFVRMGLRLIAYSRRGHRGSSAADPADPGTGAGDLRALADALKLDRFHIVASAAGSRIGADFLLSWPERVLSFTNSNGLGGIEDEGFLALAESLRPAGFEALPAEFRELGPSYRAARPEGVKAWLEIHRAAYVAKPPRQRRLNRITRERLAAVSVPVLHLTGEADLYTPPSLLRQIAACYPGAESSVIAEVGHALHWERPHVFNQIVTDFIARASRAGA